MPSVSSHEASAPHGTGRGKVHVLVADERRAVRSGVRWSSPPSIAVSSSHSRHSLLDWDHAILALVIEDRAGDVEYRDRACEATRRWSARYQSLALESAFVCGFCFTPMMGLPVQSGVRCNNRRRRCPRTPFHPCRPTVRIPRPESAAPRRPVAHLLRREIEGVVLFELPPHPCAVVSVDDAVKARVQSVRFSVRRHEELGRRHFLTRCGIELTEPCRPTRRRRRCTCLA